jgi:hypothetical protein
MSTPQATVFDFFNLSLGNLSKGGVGAGLRVGGKIARMVGIDTTDRIADTNDAAVTVQAVAVITHQWAAKVGKYNDSPIWAEVFQSVQDNRRRLKEGFNDLA